MSAITDQHIDRLSARAATCIRLGKEHASRGERSDATRMERRARSLLTLASHARMLQAVASIPVKSRIQQHA